MAMMTVKQKQWQLKYLGFYTGDIDGIWGSGSQNATTAFQREYGIKDDGIFGVNTEDKSKEVIDAIQDVLIERTKVKLINDGLAGPSTLSATRIYQQLNGLPMTGLATKDTRKTMEEYVIEYPSAGQSAGSTAASDDWWDEIEFFDREEFKCKCGGRFCDGYPAEMKYEVVKVADLARKHFGAPAHVISGLRCKTHNANEKGVTNSQHMYGEAIDLKINGVTGDQLLAFVKSIPGRTIRYAYKINSTNVHFDIPKGAR